jgi:hypothetical protein
LGNGQINRLWYQQRLDGHVPRHPLSPQALKQHSFMSRVLVNHVQFEPDLRDQIAVMHLPQGRNRHIL